MDGGPFSYGILREHELDCRFAVRAPLRIHYSLTRRKKTDPEKQAGRVMKKQMATSRNHYSLAHRKKQARKNKSPLSPGPGGPRAFNILCSGSQIPIPRQPPGCFFLDWVPSRAPARNHYSLTRRKKTGLGKQAGRVMKKQMPLLFFHYSLRTAN